MIKVLEKPAASTATVAAELRAAVAGEVRFDDGARALYSTDASNYRQIPYGVVVPKDAQDVERAIEIARRHRLPIVNRGGGTSLAGETTNAAIVIDFSKYMNHIVEIDYDAKIARVEPGCVLDDLRQLAEKRTLTFGPDPATHNHNTLGGMIGNNSCGVHAQMAGKTEENVEELEILTYDGLRMRVGPTTEDELERIIAEGGRKGEIYAKLREIRDKYADLIRKRFPDIPRRVSGFPLNELLPENGFNVARALVGTEGTCVTVLEATCRLIHSPPHRVLAILGFPDIASAADWVPFCNERKPIAVEGFDETMFHHLELKHKSTAARQDFPKAKAWLIVQFGDDTEEGAKAQAHGLIEAIGVKDRSIAAEVVSDAAKMQAIWDVREAGLGITAKIPGEADTYPGWEDCAVRPEQLGRYMREFQQLMERYGYKASLYGHFGQGCVHCRLNFDLFTREGIDRYVAFVHEAAHLCVKHGGSLSGEHGDGQSRAQLLPIMYGDELCEAFWEFKTAWDPENKMNPGKVVHPNAIDADLRWGTNYEPPDPPTYFHLKEDRGSFAYAANRCVGAGNCRKHDSGTMCPSYMATREEMHSTRGRSRLLFEMLQGRPLHGGWKNSAVKDALDLCLACKGCKSECPVNVDMATYKAEFLSHYYQGSIRPRSAYAFGLMMFWARIASALPAVANALAQAPVLNGIAKWIAGMDRRRRIPPFAEQKFRAWFRARARRNAGSQRVILWPDTWNEHFHPQTAQAAVEVLEDAGFEVTIPERRLCCGRPLYDYGMLGLAKAMLRGILQELRDDIRAGVPVVGLEPSCVSVFRDEMTDLLGNDEDADRLAKQTYLFADFIAKYAPDYNPGSLEGLAIVHQHCHHKSVLKSEAETKLLDRTGLEYRVLDDGCCGMAGAFGFEEGHYDVSMQIADRKLLPEVRGAHPRTIVVADGFSCREQIAQSTDRLALHPVELYKLALERRGPGARALGAFPETHTMPDPAVAAARYRLTGAIALGVVAAGMAVATIVALRRSS